MSNRFQGPEEANAWSTFFAAQCPRLMCTKPTAVEKEVEAAACAADVMLHAWRERAYAEENQPEGDEEHEAEEPAAQAGDSPSE